MNLYCPFCNKDCISTKCIMWENGCLIISFLYRSNENSKKIPLEEITNKTTEELAEELFQFALNEIKELPDIDIYDINKLFWLNKNIDEYLLPNDLKLKLNKAEIIAKYKLEHYDRREIDDLEDDISDEDDSEDSVEEVVNSLRDLVIKKQAPEILRNPSSEELAEKIVLYANDKFPNMNVSRDLAIESYLESIGYKRYNLPIDVRVKLENAEKYIIEKFNEKKLISIFPEIIDEDPNKLANKILEIAKKRYTDNFGTWSIENTLNNIFMDNNISFHSLSMHNRSSLEKAKNLAKEIIRNEERNIREQEKISLPSTVDLFCNWARKHDFTKITLGDTDAFLSENNMFLSKESKRDLYVRTNVILKTKNKEL